MSRLGLLAILLCWASVSVADPIYFDEAVDGDLTGTQQFNFEWGLNVITGSSQIAGELTGANDFDYFGFVLQEGDYLAGVTFEFSGGLTGDSDETVARMLFAIRDSSGQCALSSSYANIIAEGPGSQTYDSCANGVLDWSDIESGTFFLRYGLASRATGTTGDSWNYSLTFDVQRSVPEPGPLSLLGAALLAVSLSRRWKPKST